MESLRVQVGTRCRRRRRLQLPVARKGQDPTGGYLQNRHVEKDVRNSCDSLEGQEHYMS